MRKTAYGIGFSHFYTGRLDMAWKYLTSAIDPDRSTQLAENALDLLGDIALTE